MVVLQLARGNSSITLTGERTIPLTRYSNLSGVVQSTAEKQAETELNYAGVGVVENNFFPRKDEVNSCISGALYKHGRVVFKFIRYPSSWICFGNMPQDRNDLKHHPLLQPAYANSQHAPHEELRQFEYEEEMKMFTDTLKRLQVADN